MNAATQQFIMEHLDADPIKLALSAKFNAGVDLLYAIGQIKARKAVQYKIPDWYENPDILFPNALSIEQCSSEITAKFKASLLKGDAFIDLTGGFGVDCAFVAPQFNDVTYIERNKELCDIAQHNFGVLGLPKVKVENTDAVEYLRSMEKRVDCLFVDPARRSASGGKVVSFSDCEPNVTQLLAVFALKAKTVLIKASPMLDISQALKELTDGAKGEFLNCSNIFVVSVDNECKELLFLLTEKSRQETTVSAIMFHKNKPMQIFAFAPKDETEAACKYTDNVEKFLYEPNVAVLKAGAYKLLAERFGMKKLHPNSHLYTSVQLCADFPGRIFEVESSFTLQKGQLKEHLNSIAKANVTVRNFPESVDSLRKRLKFSEGGDLYLFATTLQNEQKVLIKCHKAIV